MAPVQVSPAADTAWGPGRTALREAGVGQGDWTTQGCAAGVREPPDQPSSRCTVYMP